jgi:copper chaperone CopZ
MKVPQIKKYSIMNLSKSLMAVALASFLFISCKKNETEQAKVATETTKAPKEIVAAVKPETARFSIDGMTCAIGCAKTIQEKLAEMDGVQNATVDFDKKTATVAFDATKQTPEKLVEAVEAAADGKTYKVSNLKTSSDKS